MFFRGVMGIDGKNVPSISSRGFAAHQDIGAGLQLQRRGCRSRMKQLRRVRK
jgi:hypothetical protein